MTSLDWHDPNEPFDSVQDRQPETNQRATSSGLWFAVSMGLLGVIAGFVLRQITL